MEAIDDEREKLRTSWEILADGTHNSVVERKTKSWECEGILFLTSDDCGKMEWNKAPPSH